MPTLIDELVEWYNTNQHLPVPILAAIISYVFVSIHPFVNGNGRTSRALAKRITSYKLSNKYSTLKVSDIDFTE